MSYEIDKLILKCIRKFKESRRVKTILKGKKKKRTKLEDSHFLISKLITKFIRNPDSVELYQNRHVNQQNKTENPKIKPFTVN